MFWLVRQAVSINSWLDNERHLFMPDVIDKWTPQRLYIDVNIGGNTFQVMNVKAKLFQRVWRFMLMLIDCFVFLFIRHCTKLKPPCAFPNQVHFEYQNPNFTAWAFCFCRTDWDPWSLRIFDSHTLSRRPIWTRKCCADEKPALGRCLRHFLLGLGLRAQV